MQVGRMAHFDVVRRRVPGFVKTAVLYARRRAALRRVRRITSGDERTARILRAVERTLRGGLEPEERAWIRRLAELRRRLRRSREPIVFPGTDPASAQTIGQRYLFSKSPLGALLLFRLVRELRPSRCLELGTNLGISAAYQAAALRLNGGGELHTVEGSPTLAALSRKHLASLGLAAEVHAGRFADVLPGLLARTAPLDYVFIDGHHDGPATVGYFAQLHPSLSPGALVVFDDIAWSAGMAEAWAAIRVDPRVRVAVGLGAMGVCIIGGEGDAIRIDLPIPG
jgi:predicted O-methyltransferase YrrM